MNRQHYTTHRTGPLYVVNRVSMFHKSTIESHTNDLFNVFKENRSQEKGVVVLISDNEPDWTVNSLTNIYFLYRLWKDCNLDALILNSYCPGYSAYNPIEHAWSPLSSALSGVVLPATLPDESLPPCKQGIPSAEQKEKEAKVSDNAMRRLDEYWCNVNFDGFKVSSSHQPCLENGTPHNAEVHDLLSKSPRAIKQNNQLYENLQHCIKHIYRRIHSLTILKCKSADCTHCTTNPITSRNAVKFVQKHKGLPSPLPDKDNEGHSNTFIENLENDDMEFGDTYMPKFQHMNLGKCFDCPLYSFVSKTEKEKHHKLFH